MLNFTVNVLAYDKSSPNPSSWRDRELCSAMFDAVEGGNSFMNRHAILMIIGCVLPLLLIFLAPLFGLDGRISILVFVVAMFLCHLLMPMHFGARGGHSDKHFGEGEAAKK